MAAAKCSRGSGKRFWSDRRSGSFGNFKRYFAGRKKVAEWDVCAEIGAAAGKIDKKKLLEAAKSPVIEKRLRDSTAEFHAMQITQRPTFVVDTEIGDRAIFSGVIKIEPIAATIESMLADATFYAAHKAHFGDPPAK